MKVSYNWLKEYLGEKAPTAKAVEDLLTFHAFEIDGVEEVGSDQVIDVDILPNRSSDCLCHRGIAREIATLTNSQLVKDPLATPSELLKTDLISVTIENAADCPRFTASLITDIKVKESPQWLKDRLEALGQRSINNIVDATNYVMYAIGQPLHAYDADKFPQVDGKWQFGVRKATVGETVSLLAEGGKTEDRVVELSGTELLIIDESSNTPIGLAGVKGGRFAGVDEKTTKIIVEAAHFDPTLTRKTARGLGIVIDASKRFENEPSRELPTYAQGEIANLITEIAGGQCVGWIDEYLEKKSLPAVTVRAAKVNELLGLNLETAEMISITKRLGAQVEEVEDGFIATGPFERTDLNIEADYIEEVGRIYGLTHIASVVPEPIALTEYNARQYYGEKVRQFLISNGFSEVITSSFRKKDKIQLQNALADDKSFLRSNLTKNISEVLDKNAGFSDLLGATDTRVFEIGTVFNLGDKGVTEHVSLCVGVRLKVSGYSGKEDKILTEVLSALEQELGVAIDKVVDKGVAEINFTSLLQQLPAVTGYELVEKRSDVQYKDFSIYPHMNRDIALWVDAGTIAADVEAVLNNSAGNLRVRTDLFDEFTKDSKTSFAFRLVFQSKKRTLTDREVNGIMDDINLAVAKVGWEAR